MTHTPGLTGEQARVQIAERIARAAEPHLTHTRGDRRHSLAQGLRRVAARIDA